MTRETKIGLLVGLCFIIVIGILLSDHFRATMEPPEAVLANAGQNVRNALSGPGTANPPVTIVGQDAPPTQQVPTQNELQPQVSPVVPTPTPAPANNDAQNTSRQPAVIDPNQTPAGQNTQNQTAGDDSTRVDKALNEVARAHGEQLVPAGGGGNSTGNSQVAQTPTMPVSAHAYKAQSGDTVSHMAAKFLGSSSRANVQAIVDANPSLRDDPDTVIVGQTYIIPTHQGDAAPSNQTVAIAPAPQRTSVAAAPAGEYFYVVQEGDSLWRIANDQLGDPSTISALKELNASILKGKDRDVVQPGMKLRLPARPIASAS